MQFFKRILQASGKTVAPKKRQGGQRLVVGEEFPLRVATALGAAGDRWNWKCRLLNCSEPGVRIETSVALPV